MKKIKKIITVLSIVTICFGISAKPVSAESSTEIKKNLSMKEQYYLQNLEEINPELESELGELVSINQQELVVDKNGSTKEQVSLMSTIETVGKITLTIGVYKRDNNDFLVSTGVKWSSAPFFQFTDIVATSWGNSMALISHSTTRMYRYRTTSGVPRLAFAYGATTANMTPNTGIGVYIPTVHSFTDDENYYRTAPLEQVAFSTVIRANGSATTNISSGYVHNELSIKPSLSFGSGGLDIKFGVVGKSTQLKVYTNVKY